MVRRGGGGREGRGEAGRAGQGRQGSSGVGNEWALYCREGAGSTWCEGVVVREA